MEWANVRRYSREELVERLQKLVAIRGEGVTLRAFERVIGRSHNEIERHFANWGELRLAAGLGSRRPVARKQFADDELIAEYRRVCVALGRTPSDGEFDAIASCRFITLRKRFGDGAAIRRRAAGAGVCVVGQGKGVSNGAEDVAPHPACRPPSPRAESMEGREPTTGRRTADGAQESVDDVACGSSALSWVAEWLLGEWKRGRVGFTWHSRHAVGKTDEVGLVFCSVHDWAECPVPVVVMGEAVRNRVSG